ncbi:hypothetical protein CSW51_05360 [Thermus scotoductus]|nr:hypothetical protein CSW51_05360 [Thermus scotoductus]
MGVFGWKGRQGRLDASQGLFGEPGGPFLGGGGGGDKGGEGAEGEWGGRGRGGGFGGGGGHRGPKQGRGGLRCSLPGPPEAGGAPVLPRGLSPVPGGCAFGGGVGPCAFFLVFGSWP